MTGEADVSRQQLMQESLLDVTHQRYGLFSYSTMAIGDDSVGRKTKPRRDAEGAVVTEPRNFYTKRLRKGKTPDVYFEKPAFCSVGDPYVKKAIKPQAVSDTAPFKPAGPPKETVSPFPHEVSETHRKKNFRDAEGAVVVGPKNVRTSPPKKGEGASTPGVLFSGLPAVSEPYERKHQLVLEEQERAKAGNRHDHPFKGISHGDRTFHNNVKTFGKVEQPARSPHRPLSVPVAEHDHPFKPSSPAKKGIHDMTIGGFPEYKPQGEARRQPRSASDERKWK